MNVQLAGVMRVVLNLLRYRDDVRRPTIMADGVCLNPSTGTGVEYEKEAARPSAASKFLQNRLGPCRGKEPRLAVVKKRPHRVSFRELKERPPSC